MFLNPFQPAFGLDIGDRSIKIVQLRRRDGWRSSRYFLQHVSEIALPAGWIADGEILKPEEILKALTRHFAKKKDGLAASPWVVASLPETKTYIQLIKIKNNNNGPAGEAEILQAAPSYLPYDLEDVYLDWQILPPAPTEKETVVLLGAVPKKIADSYIYLLNIAGLTPVALEVEATAICRAVINRRKNLDGQARGILDLGATRSSFIVFDRGCIQFSLSLPISGLEITEQIRAALNLDFAQAEEMKKECGLDAKKCRGQLKEVLENNLQNLTEKIFQAIQFYKLHFPEGNRLTGIRLIGGGANLPALENYLSAKLKLKVRRANPWINLFQLKELPLDENRSLLYGTAVGLAMRALNFPFT